MKDFCTAHPICTCVIVFMVLCIIDNMWGNFCRMMSNRKDKEEK